MCPPWCTVDHGVQAGEEDWLHVSAPVFLTDGVAARLCLSIDPESGAQDGPFVVIGSTEYTLAEAAGLGVALIEIAQTATRAA